MLRALISTLFPYTTLFRSLPDDAFTPRTGRGLFVLYCIASAIYRWVVLFGIAVFLYKSEEHTSELQSQSKIVCRLLLEKKKIVTMHEVITFLISMQISISS